MMLMVDLDIPGRSNQWRIQDFPREGYQPGGGGGNLLFDVTFVENCIKKEGKIGLAGRSLDPPLLMLLISETRV